MCLDDSNNIKWYRKYTVPRIVLDMGLFAYQFPDVYEAICEDIYYLSLFSDDIKWHRKYIIPRIVPLGRIFTDQEFAVLYDVNLSTVKRWKKHVQGSNPKPINSRSHLTDHWIIRTDGKWEKSIYGLRARSAIESEKSLMLFKQNQKSGVNK